MRFFSLLLLCVELLISSAAVAAKPVFAPDTTRRRYLVYFRDKANTPYRVEQPQAFLSARALQRRTRQGLSVLPRDLPVDPAYVAGLNAVPGARVWYTSRWFNAAVVHGDSATLAAVQALPFVRSARALNRGLPPTTSGRPLGEGSAPPVLTDRGDYGPAYTQNQLLGAVDMHKAGFRGEGMQIAVFDDGFPGVNTLAAFAPLRQENRLGAVFNFVKRTRSVYELDSHGTLTLSTMAANEPGVFIGTAPQATYHLFITEDVSSEHPMEEVNWLLAAEKADSLGVDIISSSVGYNTFDYPSSDESYTYADMDGRTALVTRAATIAARVGMLVVNSAGNEGNNSWRYVLAPADADSILTVGAVDSLLQRASFSSTGPTADGRLKPNVSAMGRQAAVLNPDGGVGRGNGTSLAAPLVAGLAAGFWQSSPTLTAQQVLSYLQQAGSHAAQPDNLTGYGVPTFSRAYALANPGPPLATTPGAALSSPLRIYPNPAYSDELYVQLPAELRTRPLTVRLYDARGRLVATLPLAAGGAAAVPLQLGPLASGLYHCRIQAGEASYLTRFLKL